MNEERLPEPGELARLEERLKTLRPAEVPEIVRARLQFELGRQQGLREARRAILAYAAAASFLTWFVTTSKVLRNDTHAENPVIAKDRSVDRPGKDGTSTVWTLDQIKRVAREIEKPPISVTSRSVEAQFVGDSTPLPTTETPAKEGWDRQRWYQELIEETLPKSG